MSEAILVKWGHPQVVRFIFEGSSQSEQRVDGLKVFKSYIWTHIRISHPNGDYMWCIITNYSKSEVEIKEDKG